MLDFELLRAFVAVADCGGFHRAAERLNLTQSTISQQIKRLEVETKRPSSPARRCRWRYIASGPSRARPR
jgi:DNA-binding MarR family transcriptional regulator